MFIQNISIGFLMKFLEKKMTHYFWIFRYININWLICNETSNWIFHARKGEIKLSISLVPEGETLPLPTHGYICSLV